MYGYLVYEIPSDLRFYGIITIIAVLFTVLPLFLNLFALNKINSATIGILMYINPIFNFLIAFLIFNEEVTLLQATGYAIICLALGIFNYSYLKKMQTALSAKQVER